MTSVNDLLEKANNEENILESSTDISSSNDDAADLDSIEVGGGAAEDEALTMQPGDIVLGDRNAEPAVVKKANAEEVIDGTVKDRDIEKSTVTKELDVPITSEQKQSLYDQAADAFDELAVVESEFDQNKKDFKARIDKLQETINKTLSLRTSGKITMQVECEVEKDFDQKAVRYFYEGKLIETRAMTSDEMQAELKLGAPTEAQKEAISDNVEHSDVIDISKMKKQTKGEEIADIIKDETGRASKRSAVDGPVSTHAN